MLNRFHALLTLLTFLVFCAPGWTEQHTETPTYRSKTDVVLVPVVVRSKNGPMEGLKPEQVFITEDGKPQKVASVELIKTGTGVKRRESPGVFSNELVSPGPARLTIIAIDMINTPFLDQAFAREQVLKYLAAAINKDEQFAIFGMYRDGSARLIHDISSDTTALTAAIKGATGVLPNSATDTKTVPIRSQAEAPALNRAEEEEQAWQQFKEARSGPGALDLLRNMEETLSSMRQIGETFAGAPGRKAIIWITGSFPLELNGSGDLASPQTFFSGSTVETGDYHRTHSGALPPMAESSHLINEVDLSPLRQQFRTLLQQFASGNIVLYPVDARGVMTLNIEAADDHTNRVLLQFDKERAQTSLLTIQTMAAMTGGKACFNKNDIVSCVRDASQDSEQYYLVSYYRDKKNNKQGWRKLSVKVDQPDVEVRSRTGYFYGSNVEDKNASTRAFSTAMKSSLPFSSVPFSAKFMAITPEGKNKLVKFEIYIPPKTVELVDQGDNKIQLEVIAVVSTAKDPRVDQVGEMLGANLPPEAIAAIHQQGIAYDNVLKLPPGEYSVHFLVRNVATNAVGSVIAPLKVE